MSGRFRIGVVFFLLASLFPPVFAHGDGPFAVDEAAMRAEITTAGLLVTLPFRGPRPRTTEVRLELLEPDGTVSGHAVRTDSGGGQAAVVCLVPLPSGQAPWRLDETLVRRLRYHVASGDLPVSEGIVAISRLMPDVFQIVVAAPGRNWDGSRLGLTVFTRQPVSQQPVPGVDLLLTAVDDASDLTPEPKLELRARSNRQGIARFDFDLPEGWDPDDLDLTVRGTRNGVSDEVDFDVEDDSPDGMVLVSTDKGLYQPGQIVHVRSVVFDGSRRALANAEGELRIVAPDGETVFRTDLKTSRFGVASADWQTPDSVHLGQYLVDIEFDDDRADSLESDTEVVLSRYDLPNFTVNAATDKSYYLPGDSVRIDVSARYLFGHPVVRGQARIVRESSREWNFKAQKWEVDEGGSWEGAVENGSFKTTVDLSAEFGNFQEDSWHKYEDLPFVAYVTDESTGRTEQRRFDVRLTREPIHVYPIFANGPVPGLPYTFFVSANLADGAPVACTVDILEMTSEAPDSPGRKIATVRTNRFGLARIDLKSLIGPSADAGHPSVNLRFDARDDSGRGGRIERNVYAAWDRIQIRPARSLLKPGEPVRCTVETLLGEEPVFVEVMRDGARIESTVVTPRGNRAEVVLPWRPEFQGDLTVMAFARHEPEYDDVTSARCSVLYPEQDQLKISLRGTRGEYRPGDRVRGELQVRTDDGHAVESVLGVAVVDRAVEERERTNQDFGRGGGYWTSWHRYLRSYETAGGVTLSDLKNLKPRDAVSPELELAASVLLAGWDHRDEEPGMWTSYSPVNTPGVAFRPHLTRTVQPLWDVYQHVAGTNREYPSTGKSLREAFSTAGVRFDDVRDPWGQPYHARFGYRQQWLDVAFVSAGPDEIAGTGDDITAGERAWPYFAPLAAAIERELGVYFARTGEPVTDEKTLLAELELGGVPRMSLVDPWGTPYRFTFDVNESHLITRVDSAGPDKEFASAERWRRDDFQIWSTKTEYFAEDYERIDAALRAYTAAHSFPKSLEAFADALRLVNMDVASLHDPLGRPLRVVFDETPNAIRIWTAGRDGWHANSDDTVVAVFSRERIEQSVFHPGTNIRRVTGRSASGAMLRGTVTDPQGAVIPGARVHIRHLSAGTEASATTSANGVYVFQGLQAGTYDVKTAAEGFAVRKATAVLRANEEMQLDLELSVSGVGESVEVSAGSENVVVNTQSQTLETTVLARQIAELPIEGRDPSMLRALEQRISTPRPRQYFPETLYWRPSIETDARGRATVDFQLADNITTWKLGVVASTADGRIGLFDADIRSFQPFFAEHEPPKVLTEGDEVDLPVVLRNYLDAPLKADVSMDEAPWFVMTGPGRRQVRVPAGDSARVIFPFRATSEVVDAPQRVTALGAEASDAIEKPVSVHPDGEPRSIVRNSAFTGSTLMNVQVPATAVGRPKATLRVYPNVLSQVVDSVEAIMRRPYGCGEQTISSTYPSILVLRYADDGDTNATVVKARGYARQGYDRLLGYRTPDGGFSYWGGRDPDFTLTAYAVRFLTDASTVIDIDGGVLDTARDWLVARQAADGSWPVATGVRERDAALTVSRTAYIAGILSSLELPKDSPGVKARDRALDFIAGHVAASNNPYFLAAALQAAAGAKREDVAAVCVERLLVLARVDGDGTYWEPETGTPFNGWGRAGAIETTALVVKALAGNRSNGAGVPMTAAIDRGIVWLLGQKDEYGVWYSTQATIRTLDALLEVLSSGDESGKSGPAEIRVLAGGQVVATEPVARLDRFSGPVVVDLSKYVTRASGTVEIVGPGSRTFASLAISYHEPWPTPADDRGPRAEAAGNSMKLSVAYDRLRATTKDWITCSVEAGRTSDAGRGMLLGEIGLPPGAEVDRDSLERAVRDSGWRVCRYDVLPDRVVVYLWPGWKDTGVNFTFRFRVRYGIAALAAPSSVYDYYNPDARVAIAPARFHVTAAE